MLIYFIFFSADSPDLYLIHHRPSTVSDSGLWILTFLSLCGSRYRNEINLGKEARVFTKKSDIHFFRLLVYSAWFESSEIYPKCGICEVLSTTFLFLLVSINCIKGSHCGIFVHVCIVLWSTWKPQEKRKLYQASLWDVSMESGAFKINILNRNFQSQFTLELSTGL
jgi:hypothetical protein